MTSSTLSSALMSRSSSMMGSIRSYGLTSLASVRINKQALRVRLLIPQHVPLTMLDCIKNKDVDAGDQHFQLLTSDPVTSPEAPMVVFINTRSGGQAGPNLKDRLRDLLSDEQVFDLLEIAPNDFVRYGLGCLEKHANNEDVCAKQIREKIRVVVAGGDGTVGWVLGCLGELPRTGREPVPPVAIIPLGTGNDLARSFSWVSTFPFSWKSLSKRILHRAASGPICSLDSWQITLEMPASKAVDLPHTLKPSEECETDDQNMELDEEAPKTVKLSGVFYSYFSIGMDAQVAYGFHSLRNERPYLALGPISNKLLYSTYGCSHGWFLTPCASDPSLRGLKNILRIHVKKVNSTGWVPVPIPKSVRAIVALNLHNYGSGRNPWGTLRQAYLDKKGFVEANVDDGLLEIFGLKQGWHASFVMADLISAKHIAQAAEIRMELRGGEWKESFMQMDGEPWKQNLSKKHWTVLEIKRMPFQSIMISGNYVDFDELI
ncbi:diacylglycerol kinase 4-like [Hibiscus syriacus]|uniref:diacylglycerol kinase 4-like n=1 Tax=Hibiscus syriacus TaxID=106335 RepID=UPI001924A776|nr:diacylglycerol kinase 4-like [Hibiscus syriacus]